MRVAGIQQHSEHLYLPAPHSVNWSVFAEPLGSASRSRLSEDSDLTYSISFSQIGPEVETVSAVAVCTDRMHISIPGRVGLFGALGRRGEVGAGLLLYRGCEGSMQIYGQEDDTDLRGPTNQLYLH